MRSKKICLVIPSLQAGGMERVMSELAAQFCQKTEVHLVMYGIKPEIFYPLPSNLSIHIPAFKFDNNKRIRSTIKRISYLRRETKKIQPDVILSFGEYWNSFVLISLFGLRYPIFVSDRCQPDKSLGKLHNILRTFLYPTAAGVIVQTETARQIYQKLIPKAKLHVIGNPIRIIGNDSTIIKENIVLSVGRLIKSKHHDELIRLFVQIAMPGWKLVIIGDDAIRQQNLVYLKTLIAELNAKDKVLLTGSRNDVDVFYQKSRIFAFASSSEGFPNVIGEAMSAGLPVVAFDCIAGPSDLIENNVTGFLVPLFDYSTFEKKLRQLMMDENLQKLQGTNGNKKILKFSSQVIGEKFYEIILP